MRTGALQTDPLEYLHDLSVQQLLVDSIIHDFGPYHLTIV